ncbi:MAG: hypothetical protein ACWGNV_13025 [Bacteroidales bacterium]
MYYHEKQNYVNIFSGILITAVFAYIVYQKHLAGSIDITGDYKTWGILMLVFVGISIVARIVIQIIFHIINAIVTREEEIPKKDERDKMIGLKATRNAYYALSGIMVVTILLLAVGMPVYGVFIAFVISGLVTEIVENSSQIFYYRKDS